MAQVLCHLPKVEDKNLLIGLETSDDAAVYKISEDLAIIQSLDFFTPIVDDPYMFGQIAAANSLSDIYAMGGTPLLAMNIVCFPTCVSMDVLTQILKGGADKVKQAGALLVGGHSVDDNEPKYGLSVTGIVSPNKVMGNHTSKPGDLLILTKPLGTGILNTAIKAEMLSKELMDYTMKVMASLNNWAAEGMKKVGANSCTDITGFGFLGHAYEMAKASGVTLYIDSDKVPLLKGTIENAQMGLVPAGAYKNAAYIHDSVFFEKNVPTYMQDILFDPQTSGGLLISLPKENAKKLEEFYTENLPTEFAIVGEVKTKEDKYIKIR